MVGGKGCFVLVIPDWLPIGVGVFAELPSRFVISPSARRFMRLTDFVWDDNGISPFLALAEEAVKPFFAEEAFLADEGAVNPFCDKGCIGRSGLEM